VRRGAPEVAVRPPSPRPFWKTKICSWSDNRC
jgi:hypothetical protein